MALQTEISACLGDDCVLYLHNGVIPTKIGNLSALTSKVSPSGELIIQIILWVIRGVFVVGFELITSFKTFGRQFEEHPPLFGNTKNHLPQWRTYPRQNVV